jgi:hypothetical protein
VIYNDTSAPLLFADLQHRGTMLGQVPNVQSTSWHIHPARAGVQLHTEPEAHTSTVMPC